jgi:hypothetical protein
MAPVTLPRLKIVRFFRALGPTHSFADDNGACLLDFIGRRAWRNNYDRYPKYPRGETWNSCETEEPAPQ